MKSLSKSTIIATLTLLAALAVPAMAQNNRVPVGIELSGHDGVGMAFVYALQEQLNHSTVLQYTSDNSSGLVLKVLSVDENTASDANHYANLESALAITLVIKQKDNFDSLVDQLVFAVGKDKTDKMAKTRVEAVNDDVNKLRKIAAQPDPQQSSVKTY